MKKTHQTPFYCNKIVFLNLVLIAIISLGIPSCSKDNDGNSGDGNEPTEYNIGFIEPTSKSSPYIFTSLEEKTMVVFERNQKTNEFKSATLTKNDEVFYVRFSDDGLPMAAYVNNYYFIFSNYNKNTVTITAYDSSRKKIGEKDFTDKKIGELIEINGLIDDNLKSANSTSKNKLKAATVGVSVAGCAISGVVAYFSGGLATGLAVISCSSALLTTIDYFAEKYDIDYDKDGYLSNAAKYATLLDCSTTPISVSGSISCVTFIANLTVDSAVEHADRLMELANDKQIKYTKDASDCISVNTSVIERSDTYVKIAGEITLKDGSGNYNIKHLGVDWGRYSLDKAQETDNKYEFLVTIENLAPETYYYARAYVGTDSGEKIDGNLIQFYTSIDEGFFAGTNFYKTSWDINVILKEEINHLYREAKNYADRIEFYDDYTETVSDKSYNEYLTFNPNSIINTYRDEILIQNGLLKSESKLVEMFLFLGPIKINLLSKNSIEIIQDYYIYKELDFKDEEIKRDSRLQLTIDSSNNISGNYKDVYTLKYYYHKEKFMGTIEYTKTYTGTLKGKKR